MAMINSQVGSVTVTFHLLVVMYVFIKKGIKAGIHKVSLVRSLPVKVKKPFVHTAKVPDSKTVYSK